MKLLNPSDSELDAAFAEKVAGWSMSTHILFGTPPNTRGEYRVPYFTTSADAVLPWLTGNGWAFSVEVELGRDGNLNVYELMIYSPGDSSLDGLHRTAEAPNWFPRAAVIALLQAHAVEVEFTA